MKCLGRNSGSLEARLPGDDAGKARIRLVLDSWELEMELDMGKA